MSQILHLSDLEITRLCDHGEIIYGDLTTTMVVRILDKFAVKISAGPLHQEAEIQRYVYARADPSILRVPEVFRDFSGYLAEYLRYFLVMEFIPGSSLDQFDIATEPSIMRQIGTAIQHLADIEQLERSVPGPIGDTAVAQGYIWSDDGAEISFHNTADMEEWMNKRLRVLGYKELNIQHLPLTMRHMDLCRRNIIYHSESLSITFIDWGSAGFYPAVFERSYIYDLRNSDPSWFDALLKVMSPLSEEQLLMIPSILAPAAINLRYSLSHIPSPTLIEGLPKRSQLSSKTF